MATTLLAIGSRRLSKSLSLFRQADPDGDSQRMPHPSDAMHTTHRLAPGVHKAGNVMIFFLRHPSQVQSMHMDSDGIAVEHIARVATQLKCSAECDILGRVCRVTTEECPGHFRLEQQPSVTIDGEEYSFTLYPHPFRDGYSAELPVRPTDSVSVSALNVNGTSVTLASPSTTVDAEYALTLARESVDDDGEIVLRLTENTVSPDGGAYWYVSFVSESHTSSVIINALSGEIGAMREG